MVSVQGRWEGYHDDGVMKHYMLLLISVLDIDGLVCLSSHLGLIENP